MCIDICYKVFNELGRNDKRDILAILENCSLQKEVQLKVLSSLYQNSTLTPENTQFLTRQTYKIKPYYLQLIVEDLSAKSQKLLFSLLVFFDKEETLSENLYIKSCAMKHISKCIKNNNTGNLVKELEFNRFRSINKKSDVFSHIWKKGAESKDYGEYGIKKLNDPEKTNSIHIFVNGFTNDKKGNNFKDWEIKSNDVLSVRDALYGFDWPSGKLNSFLKIIIKSGFKAKGNVPFGIISSLTCFLSEWKLARDNAEKYAQQLSQYIDSEYKNNPNIKIHLYGHSLGARLVYFALDNLESSVKIEEVFFFGGAVHIDEISATDILRSAKNIYNFYSSNDDILSYMYKTAEIGEAPIGLNQINCMKSKDRIGEIYNFNVTEFIGGHTEYTSKFDVLYRRKYIKDEYR